MIRGWWLKKREPENFCYERQQHERDRDIAKHSEDDRLHIKFPVIHNPRKKSPQFPWQPLGDVLREQWPCALQRSQGD